MKKCFKDLSKKELKEIYDKTKKQLDRLEKRLGIKEGQDKKTGRK